MVSQNKPRQNREWPLRVTMFQSFTLTVGPFNLREKDSQQDMLWHLLQILIAHRYLPLTNETIIGYLWGEAPPEHGPRALKNLVYRLRKTLTDHGVTNAKQLIVWDGNGYRWNNKFVCIVDSEEIKRHYHQAVVSQSAKVREEHFGTVMTLYKGHYLPTRQHEPWTVPLRQEYHQMFLTAADGLVDIYWESNNHLAVEAVAREVLEIDPFAEAMHITVLQGLMQREKFDCAISHYRYTAHRYHQAGKNLPSSLIHLYHRLLEFVAEEKIIGAYQHNAPGAAFYCEYDTFRTLYLSEARAALTLDKNVYLVSIQVDLEDSGRDFIQGSSLEENSQESEEILQAMGVLHTVLLNLLQSADVFTKVSENHYMVLLIRANVRENHPERVQDLVERLVPRFRYLHRNPHISLRVNLQELTPDTQPLG